MKQFTLKRPRGYRKSGGDFKSVSRPTNYITFSEEDSPMVGFEVFETEGRHDPEWSGLFGPDGQPIYYEGVEWIPMGFHHKYDKETGELILD